jgi:formamidopyrimidine-DNA glycosylase
MPELPEVEVTRRSVAPGLTGATVLAVWRGKSLRWPLGCAPQRLVGERFSHIARRGKYLLAHTASGTLIVHLGMSGSLRWHAGPAGPRGPWVRFELQTDRGVLRLDDPRRFGAVVWAEGGDVASHRLLKTLGVEPLTDAFDGEVLYRHARGKKSSAKALLLSGVAVVGVGNIYACEALFEAGIDPRTAAGRLSRARCERLAGAIKSVLARAIEVGGSTLRDFADGRGEAGYFQLDAAVYGRAGQPCKRCGATVRRIVQAQRSSYFCPACQRR